MSIPIWVLLGFAAWTILLLISTIGVYRWSLFLTHRVRRLSEFNAGEPHGSDWYRRAMRAHANCIENLPIYTAIVIAIIVTQIQSPILDYLAITLLIARIFQSLTHVIFPMTNTTVSIRFTFFVVQLICMVWMGIYIILSVH